MSDTINRQWLLRRRPEGMVSVDDFEYREVPVPEPDLAAGEILVRNLYLGFDPAMRGWITDARSYIPPVPLGEPMRAVAVAEVVASENAAYPVGTLVQGLYGWQEYAVASPNDPLPPMPLPEGTPPTIPLSVMGMTSLTAYFGLLDVGQPKAGETVVVSGAAGATGSMVVQIAKLKGCRVVGIAGAPRKCQYAVETLGYDACISHYDEDMPAQLAAACPDGIDVYFENVGGSSWAAVMPLLNTFARIPVCGLIAHYNETGLPPGPDRMVQLQGLILRRSLKMQGFIVSNYRHRYPEFARDMATWLAEGKVTYREDVVEGLENAPQAFLGLFSGQNFGKLVVRVS